MTVPAPADPLATWTPQAALGLTCAGCHPEYRDECRDEGRPEEWDEDRGDALPAPPDDHTETAPRTAAPTARGHRPR